MSAALADDAAAPHIATLPHELGRVKRYLDRLARDGAEIRCVYEASGAGYVLQRAIQSWGYHCDVCAPSLTPRRPGHQRKHNRYDAKELAHFYRSGDLVLITSPTSAEESTRELVRCRTTMQRQLHRARQFVVKFCTRHGLRYAPVGTKRSHWTQGHRAWLRGLARAAALSPEAQAVLTEYLALLAYTEQRRDALDRQLEALVLAPALRDAVHRLGAFRGIDFHGALVLGTEIREWRRFAKPTELMAYVGLVPREASSAVERRGPITKMGNAFARHILVQAAWSYRHPPRVGRALKARQADVAAPVIVVAWKAQHRLHKLYQHLAATRGRNKAVVAVARELVGFLWAAMTLPAPTGTPA